MTIRDRIISEALALEGLCACRPWRDAFAATLGKVKGQWWLNVPFHYANGKTEGVSTCALTGFRGVLHRAGVATDAEDDYVFGTVFEVADRMLKPALVTGDALRWIMPVPGDALVVGSGLGTHWAQLVGYEGPGDAPVAVTIDAGQTCPHDRINGHEGLVARPWGVGKLQAVKLCKRPWTYTAAGLPKLGDRVVRKWYSADLMPLRAA